MKNINEMSNPELHDSSNMLERERDPKNGILLPNHCELYFAGHSVHWIQSKRSYGQPHRSGKLVEVDGNVVSIDFDTEVRRYRNCDPDRLLEIVAIGDSVRVCEPYAIMRTRYDYCFSVAPADDPWVPCDYSPLTSASPEALAQRAQSHGGFSVPGPEVLKHLGEESDR